jgi:hypothetical protein
VGGCVEEIARIGEVKEREVGSFSIINVFVFVTI